MYFNSKCISIPNVFCKTAFTAVAALRMLPISDTGFNKIRQALMLELDPDAEDRLLFFFRANYTI